MGLNMSQYVSIEIHVFIVCPEKTVTNLMPPNFHLFRDLHIDILYQPTKTSTYSFEGSDRSGSLSRCHHFSEAFFANARLPIHQNSEINTARVLLNYHWRRCHRPAPLVSTRADLNLRSHPSRNESRQTADLAASPSSRRSRPAAPNATWNPPRHGTRLQRFVWLPVEAADQSVILAPVILAAQPHAAEESFLRAE